MSRADGAKHKVFGRIKAETDRAILVELQNELIFDEDASFSQTIGPDSVWFPLSQVHEIHRTYSLVNERYDTLIVSQWIAKQKGLVE